MRCDLALSTVFYHRVAAPCLGFVSLFRFLVSLRVRCVRPGAEVEGFLKQQAGVAQVVRGALKHGSDAAESTGDGRHRGVERAGGICKVFTSGQKSETK